MTASLPDNLPEITREIHKLRKRNYQDIVQIGRLLMQARDMVEHGEWYQWLQTEFMWSRQTAENFMNVAGVFGSSKSLTVSGLDPTTLYALARPSTPEEARRTVLELIEAETPPSLADVKRIIRDAKPPPNDIQPAPASPRDAALAEQFRNAIEALMKLTTKPAHTFNGVVKADDLDLLANFLKQIAAGTP